jgi:hypothetical protein
MEAFFIYGSLGFARLLNFRFIDQRQPSLEKCVQLSQKIDKQHLRNLH